MGSTRRRFLVRLLVAAGTAIGLLGLRLLRKGPEPSHEEEESVLGAALDVLIPEREYPGHRSSGVVEGVLGDFRSNVLSLRALLDGLELLKREAVKRGAASFEALSYKDRVEVVEKLAKAEPGSTTWMFFGYLRERAMLRHYASPVSWGPLRFPGPPQPKGYYDYREPPRG